MTDTYVVDALRTPFGAFGGILSEVEAPRLAAALITALVERTGLDPAAIDEVIAGQVLSGGAGQAPARQAMRYAGLPDSVHAMTVNKVCGSGLKAILLGADSIRLDEAQLVIAGGMENMSLAPFALKKARYGYRMGHGELLDLMVYDGLQDANSGKHAGAIADENAARHGLSRQAQDDFAIRSYQLAQQAVKEGIFRDEIKPVVKKAKTGEEVVVTDDEEPFRVDFDKLRQLRPAFTKEGTVTAGNASTISDGAAMALLAGEAALKQHNLKPRARLVASSTFSTKPELFPEAPVEAVRAVCAKAGMQLTNIDLIEINEAFAAVPLIAINALKLDAERVNVNGGAVALGHPIGASGGRLAATVIRELHRRQARYGLATLCIGGGEALAAIFERV
jgi:acetyl-CoA C-acetyltransferase